jgi:hypothetical protein
VDERLPVGAERYPTSQVACIILLLQSLRSTHQICGCSGTMLVMHESESSTLLPSCRQQQQQPAAAASSSSRRRSCMLHSKPASADGNTILEAACPAPLPLEPVAHWLTWLLLCHLSAAAATAAAAAAPPSRDQSEGSDTWAVNRGWVSVTPLSLRSDVPLRLVSAVALGLMVGPGQHTLAACLSIVSRAANRAAYCLSVHRQQGGK